MLLKVKTSDHPSLKPRPVLCSQYPASYILQKKNQAFLMHSQKKTKEKDRQIMRKRSEVAAHANKAAAAAAAAEVRVDVGRAGVTCERALDP